MTNTTRPATHQVTNTAATAADGAGCGLSDASLVALGGIWAEPDGFSTAFKAIDRISWFLSQPAALPESDAWERRNGRRNMRRLAPVADCQLSLLGPKRKLTARLTARGSLLLGKHVKGYSKAPRLPSKRANVLPGLASHLALGEAFMADGMDATDAKTKPVVLRYFYRSEGGELLAFDSEPMTYPMASKIRSRMRLDITMAVDVDIRYASNREDGPRGEWNRRNTYRVVTLPSQVAQGVVRLADDGDDLQPRPVTIALEVANARPTPVSLGQGDWLDALAI